MAKKPVKVLSIKAAIIEELKRITASNNGKKPAKKRYTKNAIAIGKVIDKSDFGCKRETVWRLMEVTTGEKIPLATSAICPFVVGSVVVAIGNDNGHGYPQNVPLILINKADPRSGAVMPSGSVSNTLSMNPACIRLATPKEIEGVTLSQISRLDGII